jgi:hypothetical protein
MARSYPQTDQIVNEAALTEFGTAARAELDDILVAVDTKARVPAKLSFTSLVLNVGNTKVEVGPDGKYSGYAPLSGVSLDGLSGTFDFATGTGTGDVQTETLPSMTANYYVLVGVEIRSDQKIYVVFGSEAAAAANAGLPAFLSGSIPVGVVLMQAGVTGGQGDWITPTDLAGVTQFGAGAGGGSGGGSVAETVSLVSHGFVVGDCLHRQGGSWLKASATQLTTLADGVVSRVIDSDTFEFSFQGKISGLSGLNSGTVYFLDRATSGAVTSSPNDLGIKQPIYAAISTTEAYIMLQHPFAAQFNHVHSRMAAGQIAAVPTANNLELFGGVIDLSDGSAIMVGAATAENDIQNLTVDVSSLSLSGSTVYYLYIDREQLSDQAMSDTGRTLKQASALSDLAFLSTAPDATNPFRYVYLGIIGTDSGGNLQYPGNDTYSAGPVKMLNGGVYSSVERYNTTVNTANTHVLAHGLTGEPQFVQLYYYDGTDKSALTPTHVIAVDSTNVEISTAGLTFGSGEYVEVQAAYIPSVANQVIANTTQFTSEWYQNTSTTTIPHGLTDMNDVQSIAVVEWDVTADERRWVTPTSLVTKWDDTNLYLDWTGFSPSATLQYRVIAGGSVLPQSYPINYGGYTKFVGFGPGSYATLTAAIAAAAPGDSILINKSYSISSAEVVDVDDVKIEFMPGVKITVTGGTEALQVTASEVHIIRPKYEVDFSGTLTSCIEVSGDDCTIFKAKVEANDAGVTVTNAYHLASGADRNYLDGSLVATAGTITNAIVDDSGEDGNDWSIRA